MPVARPRSSRPPPPLLPPLAGVVFDEYHFGRFTNQYSKGEFLFDIHPPLGKLVFYAVSLLVGYDPAVCSYDGIQQQYAPECKFLALRATAAFFGSLTGAAGDERGGGGRWLRPRHAHLIAPLPHPPQGL